MKPKEDKKEEKNKTPKQTKKEKKYNKINEDEKQDDKKQNNNDNNNSQNCIIIDLEIQIGFNIENTKRFIKYVKDLGILHNNKLIVLSLVYTGFSNPKKNKKSLISLEKTTISDYKKIYIIDDYKIYQIDVDYCRKNLLEKKEIMDI